MKQKDTRENEPSGIQHRETIRDERIRVISLRDDAGLIWTAIGQRLGINRGTAQKVNDSTPLLVLLLVNTWLWKGLQKGKGKWYPIESSAIWRPPNFRRC